nr:type 4b pilus protein PilO2 [Pseudomonas sp.]
MGTQRYRSVPFWQASSRAPADQVVLPAQTSGREILVVLGMHWHTILGSDLTAQARRRARKARATHWVHAGGRAESVGTIRLARRTLGAGRLGIAREAHSGAQLFARRHPSGIHAMTWRLADGRCWLALVRDGQVLGNGDTVFNSTSQAALALQTAQARFGDALQCTREAAELLSGDPAAVLQDAMQAPELNTLASGATAASALQNSSFRRQPVLLPAAGLLIVLASVAWWYAAATLPRPSPTVVDSVPVEVAQADRASRWQDAIEDFLRNTPTPGQSSLEALWQAVGALPLRPAGWLLEGAQCEAENASGWQCSARYHRLNRLADNMGFVSRLPGTWQLHWTSLDEVTATFRVAAPAQALEHERLEALPQRYFPDADALQCIRAAFSRVDVGQSEPVRIRPPQDAAGVDIPAPPGISLPEQRRIDLHGPLRSLALVGPSLTARIAWTKLSIRIDPAAAASLRSSVLLAALSGVSYEIHR